MKHITVLGAGMVGSAIAADLCRDFRVTAVDADPQRLAALAAQHPVHTAVADLADPDAVHAAVATCDLAIGAVPGHMGFATLRTVIEAGKNVVDISFFGEDPFALDALAREHNVTAVVDCGIAPGMSNLILGFHEHHMVVESFRCLVGGLPFRRSWPFAYKAPFSPIDVLEEYTRPARLVENGQPVVKPALSDAELVDLDPIGTLEAFNTDGLRTLLATSKVPNMVEKTLRYPGHIDYVSVLRDSGFLDSEPIEVAGGVSVRPIDVTAALLFPRWRLDPGETEFTIMRVSVSGYQDGEARTYEYSLFDRYDEATQTTSMARTTGYTCSAAARMVLDGSFTRRGICPPEYLGADSACFNRIMSDLRDRRVHFVCAEN